MSPVAKAPKPKVAVRYLGHDAGARVRLPHYDPDRWINQGDEIEVPGDLAESLCEQTGNWELVDAPKPKSKKVKVDASTDDAEVEGPAEAEE